MNNSPQPSIEFFVGLSEELSNVSLRRNKSTGIRSVVLMFEKLKAIDIVNSFTKQSTGSLRLIDLEGEISIEPSGIKFIFGGDEGDELKYVECTLEIEKEEHWQRVMGFLQRYAEANGMAYSSKNQQSETKESE